MRPFRVREVIANLKYERLVEQKILPNIAKFFTTIPTKRYPKWLYDSKKSAFVHDDPNTPFMFMGLYLDGLVRKMISDNRAVDWNSACQPEQDLTATMTSATCNWKEVVHSYFNYLAQCYNKNPEHIATPADLNKWFGFLGALNKALPQFLSTDDLILFNQEYCALADTAALLGHPDIVDGNTVIDIKTTTNFKSMAEGTYLQLFSYVALMRASGLKITHMAVLLPLQLDCIRLNVSNWDSKPFLNYLMNRITTLTTFPVNQSPQQNLTLPPQVGCTVGKQNYIEHFGLRSTAGWVEVLMHIILEMEKKEPVQIMLTGRSNPTSSLTDNEASKIYRLITDNNFSLYVHAAYTINLSRPWTKKKPEDKEWAIRATIDTLQISNTIGARGIVIHTGKSKELGKTVGLANLVNNIRLTLEYATEECPLLLETPVGAGTELGATIEEFSAIYDNFTVEERKKFKVCIDTCHVFCAGYNPYEYLVRWNELQGYKTIGLIHFNDSRKTFGGCCDGHARYGTGNIGADILSRVALWCNSREIAMVTE